MAHTFSSLSPKHHISAQPPTKKILQLAPVGQLGVEEQSFINPFSIASRKDSEQDVDFEATAEGFYKNPDHDQESFERNDNAVTVLSTGNNNSARQTPHSIKQLSPFDVVLLEQQK